jgi:uncharacterized protein (DUF58 family)
VLVVLGLVAAGFVALFVMLWVALVAVTVLFFNALLRRVLPRKRRPRPGGAANIIEGEFRVEPDDRAR